MEPVVLDGKRRRRELEEPDIFERLEQMSGTEVADMLIHLARVPGVRSGSAIDSKIQAVRTFLGRKLGDGTP